MAETVVDWLEQIRSCNDMTVEGERLKIHAIVEARSEGIEWTKIGDAMGMSRQAAHYRYARYVNGSR
jgi:hypothetical protein